MLLGKQRPAEVLEVIWLGQTHTADQAGLVPKAVQQAVWEGKLQMKTQLPN